MALTAAAVVAWVGVGAFTSTCHGAAAGPGERLVQPSAIVLRPWFGRHNVYGIFIVPDEYQEPHYTITATDNGTLSYVYDGSTDTLTDDAGIVWHRAG